MVMDAVAGPGRKNPVEASSQRITLGYVRVWRLATVTVYGNL